MKKLLILATTCAMASAAFAQNAKSAGITDTDVKSWAKNYKQIQNEFSDAGISLDEAGFSRDNIATTSKQDKAKAETILQKYGIAAPNRLNKLAMINLCASLVIAEANIDAIFTVYITSCNCLCPFLFKRISSFIDISPLQRQSRIIKWQVIQ